jgi:hypothetical protein
MLTIPAVTDAVYYTIGNRFRIPLTLNKRAASRAAD